VENGGAEPDIVRGGFLQKNFSKLIHEKQKGDKFYIGRAK
jgi:hypothetical protein